jgi:hypothetical protein
MVLRATCLCAVEIANTGSAAAPKRPSLLQPCRTPRLSGGQRPSAALDSPPASTLSNQSKITHAVTRATRKTHLQKKRRPQGICRIGVSYLPDTKKSVAARKPSGASCSTALSMAS